METNNHEATPRSRAVNSEMCHLNPDFEAIRWL
jgi:hypothetical protein